MRLFVASALLVGAALTMSVQSAEAGRYSGRHYRQSDCVPTNGPYGFYGNIWCAPNEASYMRNLSAGWPQPVPKSLRTPKPSSNYEW